MRAIEPLRQGIFSTEGRERVQVDLESPGIMSLDHFLHDAAHDVIAEISRQIADPEPSVGVWKRLPRDVSGVRATGLREAIVSPVQREGSLSAHVVIREMAENLRQHAQVCSAVVPAQCLRKVAPFEFVPGSHPRRFQRCGDQLCRWLAALFVLQEVRKGLLLQPGHVECAAQCGPWLFPLGSELSRPLERRQRSPRMELSQLR